MHTMSPALHPKSDLPTVWQNARFIAKSLILRWQRRLFDHPKIKASRLPREAVEASLPVLGESRAVLYHQTGAAEFSLQAGKVQNLRMAALALNGTVVRTGEIFSFWAQVPRPVKRNGFVPGRELREGCIIPSVGGGLCAMSNALYDGALKAGMEVVERHGHSRAVPGSMAVEGRDATVFWNHVDLRLRAWCDCVLEVRLGRGELIVRWLLRASAASPVRSDGRVERAERSRGPAVESCENCGVTSCYRHPSAMALPQSAVTAYLVDEWWPEHDAYLKAHRGEKDWLFLPLESRRWKAGRYLWSTEGFARVCQAPFATLVRSWRSRRLTAQGAKRVCTLLAMDEAMVRAWERRIPPEATHLVVSQNLLPVLWRHGLLGGRTFDVLMTRLPMDQLQKTLNAAAARHPESRTLADFRAPAELVAAESEALAEARKWITPHVEIGRLAGAQWEQVPWAIPETPPPAVHGNAIVFPSSTLGRKGAWELRAALQPLGRPLQLGGPVLEGHDFWQGTATVPAGADWLEDAAAVVLPAWVEHQPRRLLLAVSAGVPVIASAACGLANVPGVTTIPTGDVAALRAALAALPAGQPAGPPAL